MSLLGSPPRCEDGLERPKSLEILISREDNFKLREVSFRVRNLEKKQSPSFGTFVDGKLLSSASTCDSIDHCWTNMRWDGKHGVLVVSENDLHKQIILKIAQTSGKGQWGSTNRQLPRKILINTKHLPRETRLLSPHFELPPITKFTMSTRSWRHPPLGRTWHRFKPQNFRHAGLARGSTCPLGEVFPSLRVSIIREDVEFNSSTWMKFIARRKQASLPSRRGCMTKCLYSRFPNSNWQDSNWVMACMWHPIDSWASFHSLVCCRLFYIYSSLAALTFSRHLLSTFHSFSTSLHIQLHITFILQNGSLLEISGAGPQRRSPCGRCSHPYCCSWYPQCCWSSKESILHFHRCRCS